MCQCHASTRRTLICHAPPCRDGLHVSLDFFEDTFVPMEALPDPCIFDEVSSSFPHTNVPHATHATPCMCSTRCGMPARAGWHALACCMTRPHQSKLRIAQGRGLWVWQYEGCDMPFELAGLIRLRVKDVRFHKPPSAQQLREGKGAEGALGSKDNPFAPMQVWCPSLLHWLHFPVQQSNHITG